MPSHGKNPDSPGSSEPASAPASDSALTASVEERVTRIIELMRPAIQADGGDLELVGVTDGGEVIIRLHGACVGCPSSPLTLRTGIERNLRTHVPEVRSVRSVE